MASKCHDTSKRISFNPMYHIATTSGNPILGNIGNFDLGENYTQNLDPAIEGF